MTSKKDDEPNATLGRGLGHLVEALRLEAPDWYHVQVWKRRDCYEITVFYQTPVNFDKPVTRKEWRDSYGEREITYPRRGFRQKYFLKKV